MGFGFGKERGGMVCLWLSCIEWFWYNDKVERWGVVAHGHISVANQILDTSV